MGPLDDPLVLAQDLSLGGNDEPIRIDPQADGPVGEGRRHAVAIALEADQAGRRDALALLDEAVEGRRQRHQGGLLLGPDIGDGAGQNCRAGSRATAPGSAAPASRSAPPGQESSASAATGDGRASWTFFSTCPFSQPDAGLQNSGSKR